MSYAQTNLNGWDYVVAVSQEQINNGLSLLYDDNYLPSDFKIQETFFGINIVISGKFGKPVVNAIKDGLKLCDLIIPVQEATSNLEGISLPTNFNFKITTSLNSIESEIKNHDGNVYDVYVDLKDKNAVYDVSIEGVSDDTLAALTTMLKKHMQSLSGNEYKITSFVITNDSIGSYIPNLIDFSFILNSNVPDQSAFLLCCSMDKTAPKQENNLIFTSDILPNNLPAAIWIGKQYVFGEFLQPLINSSLKSSYSNANIVYDGNDKLYLQNQVDIGKPDGDHDTIMEKIEITPSNGRFSIYNEVKVCDITILDIDATVKVFSHISINLSGDNSSFESSSGVDSKAIETHNSEVLEILEGVIGIIITEIVKGIVGEKAGSKVTDAIVSNLNDAVKTINSVTTTIPALQNIEFNGHLIFDGISILDSGDVCIGIKDTKKN